MIENDLELEIKTQQQKSSSPPAFADAPAY
jgi:hypothetical protein